MQKSRAFIFFALSSLLTAALSFTDPLLSSAASTDTPVSLPPSAPAATSPATPTPPAGLRVFTAGHSFHFYVAPLLADLAHEAKIKGHKSVGISFIPGSRIIQHWNVADSKNNTKTALAAGDVDVLTLSPLLPTDAGIDRFAELGLKKNPDLRITIQQSWLSNDTLNPQAPLANIKVDHNASIISDLRKLHEVYFSALNEFITVLNKPLLKQTGHQVVYLVPVGQAVLTLREKIVAGEVPGIAQQSDLFTDALGHPKSALAALVAYCHYAVIYRQSPIGLPLPRRFSTLKIDKINELNLLLQKIAWEAVTNCPLSGVTETPATRPAAPKP